MGLGSDDFPLPFGGPYSQVPILCNLPGVYPSSNNHLGQKDVGHVEYPWWPYGSIRFFQPGIDFLQGGSPWGPTVSGAKSGLKHKLINHLNILNKARYFLGGLALRGGHSLIDSRDIWHTLPPKFNSLPFKTDGWKTILSFWDFVTFQGLC